MKVAELKELRRKNQMARRKKEPETTTSAETPSQKDETEILEEVGAQRDESGDHVVDENEIRRVGAVDAESVRENRRMQEIRGKKRDHQKGLHFNIDDVLVKYDQTLKLWPTNSLITIVRRLTGSQITQTITSFPKSGAELYNAIRAIHGRHEEAVYDIKIVDSDTKVYRGKGQITMPDTRDPAQVQQQGQPMNPYYPPQPGYPQQPAYGPQQQPAYAPQQPMYAPQQQQPPYQQQPTYAPQQQQPAYAPQQPAPQQQPAQQQQPVAVNVQPPAGFDLNALLAVQRQVFDMMQVLQQQHQQQPPQPQYAQPMQQQPVMQAPAAPASGMPDINALLALQKQIFDMMQSMQPPASTPLGAVQQPQQPQQPAQQQMNPMMAAAMMGMPPVQPPAGMMWVPGFGFVPVERLFQAVGSGGGGPGAGPFRGPYRGPLGPSDPQQQHAPYSPPQPQQPPKSTAESFREQITLLRTAVEAAQEFSSLLPNQQQQQPQPSAEPQDESPIRVIETGPAKILVNKLDGSLRAWETGWANMPGIFKFAAEQMDLFRKASAEREATAAKRHQLPPGYVEVTPGYQPPPGYVAIPVDHQSIAQAPQQQQLPQAPTQMPPPIPSPAPQQKQTWGPPTIPGGES